MWCGKIICEQEGPGPCLFCGHKTGGVAEEAASGGKRRRKKKGNPGEAGGGTENGGEASPAPSGVMDDEALARAVERKDRLLEYERSSAQRTVVYGSLPFSHFSFLFSCFLFFSFSFFFFRSSFLFFLLDDQQDYFSTDSSKWLSPEELKKQQEALRKKKEDAANRKTHITFDFAGRRVIASEGEETLRELFSHLSIIYKEDFKSQQEILLSEWQKETGVLTNPSINMPRPVFRPTGPKPKPKEAAKEKPAPVQRYLAFIF